MIARGTVKQGLGLTESDRSSLGYSQSLYFLSPNQSITSSIMGSPSRQLSVLQIDKKNEASQTDSVVEKGTSDNVMTTFNSYSPQFFATVEKKLLRIIDLRIMPLVVIIYIFSYLDRNSVSTCATSVLGIVANKYTDHPGSFVRSAEGYQCQRCRVQHRYRPLLCWLRDHAVALDSADDEIPSISLLSTSLNSVSHGNSSSNFL